MKILIVSLVLLGLVLQDYKKELKEEKTLSVSAAQLTVVIDNVFGAVEVKKGSDDQVVYRVNKRYEGNSQAELDQALEEVSLKVLSRNDSIIFYVDAPFICSKWDGCRKRGRYMNFDENYRFKFDYVLEIPESAHLNVQTVNDGNVTIEGIQGSIQASNVNGDVYVEGAKSVSRASTINGDVDVYFADAPITDGEFHTINGTIRIHCQESLNATVSAKTMHGSLYTAFDYTQTGPKLIKQSTRDGNATLYKLEEKYNIEIGENGPSLTFETLNGDIHLHKTLKN